MATSAPPSTCPTCTQPGTLKCSGCKDISYCSVECQQADWPTHKAVCSDFKNFQVRPAENMRRVLYFPAKGTKPEFKWLPVEPTGWSSWTVDATSLLGKGGYAGRHIMGNEYTGIRTQRVVEIKFDDDAHTFNESIDAVTSGRRGTQYMAPIVVACGKQQPYDKGPMEVTDGDLEEMWDFDMAAYSVLMSHLIGPEDTTIPGFLPRKDVPEKGHFLRCGPKVQAMRANCVREIRIKHAPPAQVVHVPRIHPIFEKKGKTQISPISVLIGLPLLFWKYPGSKPPPADYECGDYCNQDITYMHLDCDHTSEYFGSAPLSWMGGEVPNTLVARWDRQPLTTEVVEAFGSFCRLHINKYFEKHIQFKHEYPGTPEADKDFVLSEITPQKWEAYLTLWREKKAKGASPKELAKSMSKIGLRDEFESDD